MGPWMRALMQVVLITTMCVALIGGSELVTEGHFQSGRTTIIGTIVFFILIAAAVIPANRRMPRESPWIHYQFTMAQVVVPLFLVPWTELGIVAVVDRYSGIPLLPDDFSNTAISAVVLPVLSLALRPRYVSLTPAGLTARGGSVRVIGWSEVRNVAVERQLGVRTIVIGDARGRRTRLNAPCGLLDRDFDAKVEVIRACWLGQYDWGHYPRAAADR